jgi:hypothetical protein
MTHEDTEQQALAAIGAAGGNTQDASWMLGILKSAGISLASERHNELVGRWIDVLARPVPPEADTIIRTITITTDGVARSTTHWLEGLKSPRT